MPSEGIAPMPTNSSSILDKMWRFSAPLASVVVILWVVWQIILAVNPQLHQPSVSNQPTIVHPRDEFEIKIVSIMDEQSKALSILAPFIFSFQP